MIKLRLIIAIVYGTAAALMAFIAAGWMDGTEGLYVGQLKLVAAGVIFGGLAVAELVKIQKMAQSEE